MSWFDEMPWPTWQQAGIACAISLALWALTRLLPRSRFRRGAEPSLLEFSLVAGLYGVWRIARELPFTHEAGAVERGRDINDVQNWLHLPSEIGLQHFAISHEWLARAINAYYATVHVPALIVFLVWMWVLHRDKYPHWRNGLVYVTLGCLIIRFIRVAPPRFVPELGFVDLSQHLGFRVYGDPGTGISDQYAAMPSIHVAWAAVVSLGVIAASPHWWRWVIALHLPITMYVVAATGHHWWLDGIVALILLWIGLRFDTWWRARRARRTTSTTAGVEGPASDSGAVEVLEAP
ncbi:phosphatase PAP2 family protein [Nocardioides sp.]|uniref:phosphatase PAP2 family protein n=1 Tax=Nocardioides sp. TaxID=35761 RepID=UPI002639631C|nr:phosphatase PAP2 family protein [Nocardioides sp.]